MTMAKEHTSSFYLDEALFANIQKMADMQNISKSKVVEMAIFAKRGGYEKAFKTIARKKTKKKVFNAKGKYCKSKQKRAEAEAKQKCLFDYVLTRLSYIYV